MIVDIIDKYQNIIKDYKIHKFTIDGTAYFLICEILLIDNTKLFIRDYLFQDGKRKYSFHWQDISDKCIVRWDNVPHYQQINTFPFHKHIGHDETIQSSEPMNLEKVFKVIADLLISVHP